MCARTDLTQPLIRTAPCASTDSGLPSCWGDVPRSDEDDDELSGRGAALVAPEGTVAVPAEADELRARMARTAGGKDEKRGGHGRISAVRVYGREVGGYELKLMSRVLRVVRTEKVRQMVISARRTPILPPGLYHAVAHFQQRQAYLACSCVRYDAFVWEVYIDGGSDRYSQDVAALSRPSASSPQHLRRGSMPVLRLG